MGAGVTLLSSTCLFLSQMHISNFKWKPMSSCVGVYALERPTCEAGRA